MVFRISFTKDRGKAVIELPEKQVRIEIEEYACEVSTHAEFSEDRSKMWVSGDANKIEIEESFVTIS